MSVCKYLYIYVQIYIIIIIIIMYVYVYIYMCVNIITSLYQLQIIIILPSTLLVNTINKAKCTQRVRRSSSPFTADVVEGFPRSLCCPKPLGTCRGTTGRFDSLGWEVWGRVAGSVQW